MLAIFVSSNLYIVSRGWIKGETRTNECRTLLLQSSLEKRLVVKDGAGYGTSIQGAMRWTNDLKRRIKVLYLLGLE
uniref:Uncharacterized protein n=1 Tax=Arundo donax TaxID=35708 RepID=A0A0A9BNL4_ARUDO